MKGWAEAFAVVGVFAAAVTPSSIAAFNGAYGWAAGFLILPLLLRIRTGKAADKGE